MSVATEFAPIVVIPERAREYDRSPLAPVITLHRPSAHSVSAPLRLTQRGVAVLAAAVALLALALVGAAWLSAPQASAGITPAPAVVTVESGDTLWSVASRIVPDRDPRNEVATLQRLNHLEGSSVQVGQTLRTR